MSEAVRFEAARNITTIADSRIEFHCHPYNCLSIGDSHWEIVACPMSSAISSAT